ncbi:MAG: hypothetical protein HQL94_09065, partial [Magnetococcales bacterium]|nr:hypothetical protein [Magnetococcales bacterium]
LAAAVFAFTVTFRKDMLQLPVGVQPHLIFVLQFGWFFLAVSLLVGLWHMDHWAKLYLTYRRDYHATEQEVRGNLEEAKWIKEEIRRERDKLKSTRECVRFWHFTTFSIGIILVATFAIVNLRF